MLNSAQSVLVVRRSIQIPAPPQRVWREFRDFAALDRWRGRLSGEPHAGQGNGQRLVVYDPRVGGRIEMEILLRGAPVRYGGPIVTFRPAAELTFESDWYPNQGWQRPTGITLRLSPALSGTLVELLHFGFEWTGGDGSAEHAGYEAGWGMLQLNTLRQRAGANP